MNIKELNLEELKKLEGKYIYLDRYVKKDFRLRMPGKLLKVKDNALFIRQHDNGSGLDWKAWEEDVPFKDIVSIEKLGIFRRIYFIIKRIH